MPAYVCVDCGAWAITPKVNQRTKPRCHVHTRAMKRRIFIQALNRARVRVHGTPWEIESGESDREITRRLTREYQKTNRRNLTPF